MFPTFKIVGKVPVRIHLFINFDILGAITGAQYLITTRGMSLALELLKPLIMSKISVAFVCSRYSDSVICGERYDSKS